MAKMTRMQAVKQLMDLQKQLDKTYGLNELGKETFAITISNLTNMDLLEEQITEEIQQVYEDFDGYKEAKGIQGEDRFYQGLLRVKDMIRELEE